MKEKILNCEILVIGSGPGGATTACLLAEAGRDVILIEEGSHLPIASAPSYSLKEMDQKYRNGGLTAAFGKTKITYVEPCCVGGGSEINAGLYHRPLPETLREWQLKYRIEAFGEEELEPFFKASEKDLSISYLPDGAGPASMKLKEGADRLSWKTLEIPRCWKYSQNPDGSWQGTRQSMTETLIPRAISAGCRLLPDTKVKRIQLRGFTAQYALAHSAVGHEEPTRLRIHFQHLFICGGAIQTPALLRRSGVKRNIGGSLCIHPMVRMAALFKDPVNEENRGVPVFQVQEFKPALTLGCSNSSLPYLALWLGGQVEDKSQKLASWRNMAVYYVATTGVGRGAIRNLPYFDEPFVRFQLTDQDLAQLGEGLYRLGLLLFAAGAVELFPPIQGYSPIKHAGELEIFRRGLPHGKTDITTIHLFGSCPMGEDIRQCAVDSCGKLPGYSNIYLNDGSILPASPGANPQATIMAIARRNTKYFIEKP